LNDNDDLKQELNNENIEAPKTNDVTPTTITPVVQEELKSNNQAKNTNINMTPKKKSKKTCLIMRQICVISSVRRRLFP